MPPCKRLRFDDPEWTRRKAAIEEMYVFDRLSQTKIRQKLAEDGFSVTKSELEAQLRFWNIRKNASRDAWRYTDYRLLKREQQGKESVVYYNGRKVSRNTLKKERNRYQPDTLTKYMTAVSPKTPEGMELWIRTPTPAPLQSRWAETLPWLRFQDKLLPSILFSTTRANISTLHHNNNRTRFELFPLHRQINGISFKSVSKFIAELASIMPEPVENEIAIRAQLLMQGSDSQSFNEHVKLILYRLSNNLIEISEWTQENRESWKQILNVIECSGMTNQSLNLSQENDLTMMSIAEHLFKLCVEFRIHRLTDEGQALNSKIISWLLHSGQNPDVVVVHQAEGPILPLHHALRTGEYEFAIELLDAGPDLNKYFIDQVPPLLVLLEDKDCYYWSPEPDRVEIFKRLVLQLLDAGASLNDGLSDKGPSALAWAIILDVDLAGILIQHGAKVEYQFTQDEYILFPKSKFTRTYSVLGCAMHTPYEDEAIYNIEYLIDHVQQSDPSIPIDDLIPADVLCRAAESGFNGIIEFFCDSQTCTTTWQHTLFSALCAASYAGHRATCELLLRYGAPINGPDPERIREIPAPLHFAAFADHPDIIELLCEHGADLSAGFEANPTEDDWYNAREENYMWRNIQRRFNGDDMRLMVTTHTLHINPLGAAIIGAEGQKSSSFSTLIDYGAKLPIWAAYHAAGIPQDPWLVHCAVEQGADLNWRGADQMTALQRALKAFTTTPNKRWKKHWFHQDDCLTVINSLINAGAETTGIEAELLVLLEHWSRDDDVLIRHYQDDSIHKAGRLTMLAAVFLTRSIPRIERALAQSLGAYDASALCASVMLAISSGSIGPLRQLISNRPDTAPGNSQEGVALGLAAWHSRIDIVEVLLSKIPSSTPALIPVYLEGDHPEYSLAPTPSKEGLEAIITEAFEDKIPVWHRDNPDNFELLRGSPVTLSIWSQECLDKLLESNFRPDRLTISVAVCHGDLKLLERLVHWEMVDNNHADRPGPLYLSVKTRFAEMTRALLNAGLSPNESNDLVRFGRSPLQKAVEDGNLEVIDLLLEAGADVNAPAAKSQGATALQLAVIKGRLGIAKRLIDLGANVNASGAETDGRTALEGAAEHGRLDTVQFLLDCGANLVGDGCFQYFRAIRFAEQQGNMVVANLLKKHREWTSYDHEIWDLFNELDSESWEKLESLEELMGSSAESSAYSYMDGSPEQTIRPDDDSDSNYDSGQEDSFGEGRISPTEAEPVDASSTRLRSSGAAMSAGTGHDNMIQEDYTASHMYDYTTRNQQLGNAENGVETAWDFGPIEAGCGAHAVQDFKTTDINSQVESNQKPANSNGDLPAVWDPLLTEDVDDEMRMEEQLFTAMTVDPTWNQQLGAPDWNDPQTWLDIEMESGFCFEMSDEGMDWTETQNPSSQ